MSALLQLSKVHTHVGRYHILQGVDLAVEEGTVCVLLGRNGAGKTTTLRTIMGLLRASSGKIVFAGQSIGMLPVSEIARLGIAYVPEHMGVFSGLTVKENMTLGARCGPPCDDKLGWIFGFFPALRKFWHTPAGALSGGQKQMLSLARVLLEPRKLLLADEPSKGLAPAIVTALASCLRDLKRQGVTILLVEQDFRFAERLGDFASVLDNGQTVYADTMLALANNAAIQEKWLGFSPAEGL